MATANQICAVCDHDYNNEDNKPLVLHCGHSFCKDCFLKMEDTGNRQCPVCRSDWSSRNVDSLPVCYQLLPAQGDNNPFICEKHNNHMIIWCNTCEERCCHICLYMNHQGCSWKPVQTEIDELQGKIEEIQTRAEQNGSKNKGILRASRSRVSMDLRTLQMLTIAIKQAEISLEDQLTRLNVIAISQSAIHLTATNETAGQDILQNLKDKFSALQELQLSEPDWPSPSISADMESVILVYRRREAGDSSVMLQDAQEIVGRDSTEVASGCEDHGSSGHIGLAVNPAPTEATAGGSCATFPEIISTLYADVDFINFMASL